MYLAKNLLFTHTTAGGGGSLITLDGVGTGVGGLINSTGVVTWSHTVATSGATVFFDIALDRTASLVAPQINSTINSTLVDSITLTTGSSSNAQLYRYKWVSTSAATFTITTALTSGAAYCECSSVSYTGVTSIGTKQSTTGTGTSGSASPTCTAGQLLLQSFVATGPTAGNGGMGTLTVGGGTNHFNAINTTGSTSPGAVGLAINDATTSTTFTISATSMAGWGSLAHALTH